jgi:hypothetical protein
MTAAVPLAISGRIPEAIGTMATGAALLASKKAIEQGRGSKLLTGISKAIPENVNLESIYNPADKLGSKLDEAGKKILGNKRALSPVLPATAALSGGALTSYALFEKYNKDKKK